MLPTDSTPSHRYQVESTVYEIRSLREIISSCDKLSVPEVHRSSEVGRGQEVVSGQIGSGSSWVASFHDKIQTKTPRGFYYGATTYAVGTPTERRLNFSTPIAQKPNRPSPTVSSATSERWCMESMTPNMRYTPPNMNIRGMRMMPTNINNREAFGGYKLNESVKKEDGERGVSLCILPTPLLRNASSSPSRNIYIDSNGIPNAFEYSPMVVDEGCTYGVMSISKTNYRPSPTVGGDNAAKGAAVPMWMTKGISPIAPAGKKFRAGYNSRHFPIPRPETTDKPKTGGPRRKLSVDLG